MLGIIDRLRSTLDNTWARSFFLVVVVIGLYSLYGWRPLFVPSGDVDDGLYFRSAYGVLAWLAGDSNGWLGKFDAFLLSKAPLYSVWLAVLHVVGIPLRVAEFLLQISGAVLFRAALRPARALRTWEFAVVLFLLIANPALPTDFAAIRVGFQIGLTNLCLIASLGLVMRATAGNRERGSWALLVGLFFSLCYLNREEATWMTVAVIAAVAIVVMVSMLARLAGHLSWRSLVVADVLVVSMFFAGALPPILAVCTLNLRSYGVFMTTWRHSSAFTGLYQRLTSLEPAGHKPYIPIARATRLKAYELSPSFAKLRPFLETRKGGYWRAGNAEHAIFNGHTAEEQEVFVSYFEFCLLWAAMQARAETGRDMAMLFRAIDRELGQAVREKRIVAGASGPAILAAPVAGDYHRIVSSIFTTLWWLELVKNDGYAWPPSSAAPRARQQDAAMLTLSSVDVKPAPSVQASIRQRWVVRLKKVQKVLFPLLTLAVPVLLVWRRRDCFARRVSASSLLLWSFAVPAVGLAAFCLGMAVVDVLGFEIFGRTPYVLLGFSPLSVLCAWSFVGLVTFSLPLPPRQPGQGNSGSEAI